MNYKKYLKSQLSEEDLKIIEGMSLNLDARALSNIWPDFVDFEKRKKTEIPFLLKHIKPYHKVFDACLGSAATTIGLKLAGIQDIISNEIDEDLIIAANIQAEKYNQHLDICSYDWRNLDEKYSSKFDVVLCLGNSLTYLFKKEDQIKTLRNFRNILKPEGKLIIDERNYQYHFLEGKYKHSRRFIYCGEKVTSYPVFISNSMVVMGYLHKTGYKANLVLYPFKEGELEGLLKEAGFNKIKVFGDYKEGFSKEDPEFLTYCCR